MASVLFKRCIGSVMFTIVFIGFASFISPGYKSFSKARVHSSGDGSSPLHPIYVSVTEINHNPKFKSLEIACKIFTEDLEIVLAKVNGGNKIDFFHPKDTALAAREITAYIGRHLMINVDGRPVKYKLIGFERELDAVWSYFEAGGIADAPKTVNITNDLLYDNFKQQINLMHVTVGGKRKSTKLDYPEATAAFNW